MQEEVEKDPQDRYGWQYRLEGVKNRCQDKEENELLDLVGEKTREKDLELSFESGDSTD